MLWHFEVVQGCEDIKNNEVDYEVQMLQNGWTKITQSFDAKKS